MLSDAYATEPKYNVTVTPWIGAYHENKTPCTVHLINWSEEDRHLCLRCPSFPAGLQRPLYMCVNIPTPSYRLLLQLFPNILILLSRFQQSDGLMTCCFITPSQVFLLMKR